MTIGQLLETVMGKACSIYGAFGDCTAFVNKGPKHKIFGDLLVQEGFHSSGNELLYDGQSGEQLEAQIFIGPTYYMRLKHMVKDKINYRAKGPRTVLTRQTVQGRANDGGLRIGEMERDGLIAHGITNFLQESMLIRGDDYYMAICNKSGTIAIYNSSSNLFMSPFVDGPLKFNESLDLSTMNIENVTRFGRSFSVIRIPYAFKLLYQELQTMNIQMRIITEENVNQLAPMSFSNDSNVYTKNTQNVYEGLRKYMEKPSSLGAEEAVQMPVPMPAPVQMPIQAPEPSQINLREYINNPKQAVNDVSSFANKTIQNIANQLNTVANNATNTGATFANNTSQFANTIADNTSQFANTIANNTSQFANTVGDTISNTIAENTSIIANRASELSKGASLKASELAANASDKATVLAKAATELASSLSDQASNISSTISDTAAEGFNNIKTSLLSGGGKGEIDEGPKSLLMTIETEKSEEEKKEEEAAASSGGEGGGGATRMIKF